MHLKWFGCSLWMLLIVVQSCNAESCDCEGFYCVSDTEFQLCVDGETVGDPIPCNSGLTCGNDTGKECSHQPLCQESNACSAEGIFPNEKFINKYFRCILDINTLEWTKNEYTCPEEKYFSRETNTCVGDDSTSMLESKNMEDYDQEEEYSSNYVGYLCPEKGNFPDPSNCQSFYSCIDLGIGKLMKCPQDTYYNDEMSHCTNEVPETCTTLNSEPEKSSQTENSIEESLFSCPGVGYFGDPQNEQRFFLCDEENNLLPGYCPDNTYFDPPSVTCVSIETGTRLDLTHTSIPTKNEKQEPYPTIDDIDGFRETSQTEIDYETSTAPTEDFVTTTEYPSEESYYSTTNDVGSTVEKSHTEDDRGKSTKPTNGQVTTTEYPLEEDHYSTTNDFGSTVEKSHTEDDRGKSTKPTNGQVTTTEYPLEEDHYSTTVSHTSTTNLPSNDDLNDLNFLCPGKGYFPDPENCQYYYFCPESMDAIPVSCEDNTYFSEETTFCSTEIPERCQETTELPKNHTLTTAAPKNNSVISSTPSPSRDDHSYICTSEGYFPDPKNCQYYYLCLSNNVSIPVSCPENKFYDDLSTFCISEKPERCNSFKLSFEESGYQTNTTAHEFSLATPSTPTEEPFVCPGYGYFSNPNNCHGYFACFEYGIAVSIICPEGTYFDERYVFCSTKLPKRCMQNESGELVGPLEPMDEKEFVCPSSGIFPDPRSCHIYWICFKRNFGSLATCPKGTYYHERESICLKEVPQRCKEHSNELFTCTKCGYFADPHNCHTYHVCYPGGLHLSINCPQDTYYDEESGLCTYDKPLRCFKIGNKNNGRTVGVRGRLTSTSEMIVKNSDQLLRKRRQINEEVNEGSSLSTFVCPGRGKYPDPNDCTKYYTCFGPSPRQLSCRPGMYFDEVSGMCGEEMPERCNSTQNDNEDDTLPLTITPAPFVCPGRGKYPDPNDCTKYYTCFGPSPRQLSCRPGMYFDEVSGMCGEEIPERCNSTQNDNKDNVLPLTTAAPFVCPGRGKYPDPNDCTKYYTCFGPSPRQLSCRPGMYFDEVSGMCGEEIPERCNSNQNENEGDAILLTATSVQFECPGNGTFPDPNDCTKYYTCFGPSPRQLSCSFGMYFDEVSEICGEEMPARCNSTENENEDDTLPLTTTPAPYVCPGKGKYPDPKDCTKYYICYGPSPKQLSCRPGMYFDEVSGICGEEMPARCNSTENENEDDTLPLTTTPAPYVCPGKGKYPDPKDCTKYYICYGPSPKQLSCRPGMYFDEVSGICGEEMPARCNSTENENEDDTLPLTTTPAPYVCPGKGKYPDPKDCTKYYICYGPSPKQLSCRPGMYFDEVSGICGEEMPARCNSTENENEDDTLPLTTTPAPYVCPGKGTFPDPKDCTKFYSCFGPSPRELSCRPGMYFDEVSGMCGEEMPERCNSTQKDNEDDALLLTTTLTPFLCNGKGTFPDPNDCTKFYSCFGPSPRQLSCRPGMYFDDVTEMCGEEIPERCNSNKNNNEDDASPATKIFISAVNANVCQGEGLFIDPEDCSKYYDCHGMPQLRSCPDGTYFNNETKFCGYEIPVDCGTDSKIIIKSTSPTLFTHSDDTFQCRNPGRYSDPNDCHKFYFCNRQLEISHLTCRNSMYFNDITNSCEEEIPNRCRPDLSDLWMSDFICWERGNFSDKEDRSRYYYCPGEYIKPIQRKCPEDQYFNENRNKCCKMENDDSPSDEVSQENSDFENSESLEEPLK